VCGSPETEVYLDQARDYVTGKTFATRRCERCGVGFTAPRPENLEPFYPARYRRYTRLALATLRALYRRRVRSWARLQRQPGAALELGCGDGFMLDALRRRGWRVVGVERSEEACAYARSELGLEVHAGGLDALDGEHRFDLIILFQVLEHLPDPVATLRQCARLLKPGGTLVVGVPNRESWQARFAGADWLHLDVPRHLFHFSPASLTYAMRQAGLEVASVRFASLEHDPYGWLQSLLNRIGFRQNGLTRLLMGLDRPSVGGVAAALCAAVLLIPAVLLAAVSWLLRAGALMEVRATRRAGATLRAENTASDSQANELAGEGVAPEARSLGPPSIWSVYRAQGRYERRR
jgi:SAM-dependent methyltransferase